MSDALPARRRRKAGDGATDENVDLLRWWKTKPPQSIPRQTYRDGLILAARGLIDDAVLNQVLVESRATGTVAFTLASELAQTKVDEDVVMSWITYAALSGVGHAGRIVFEALSEQAAAQAQMGDGAAAGKLMTLAYCWLGAHDTYTWRLVSLLNEAGRSTFLTQVQGLMPGTKGDGARSARDRQKADPAEGRPKPDIAETATHVVLRHPPGDLPNKYRRLKAAFRLVGGHVDPDRLAAALLIEFPWMESTVDAIVSELHLMRRVGIPWIRFRPFLLVGPPGCGKTRLARRIGQLTGTGSNLLSVGGSSDNRMLQGTARGWSTAEPSFPLLAIMRCEIANPLVIVDEIDKAVVTSHNGSVTNTLLGMLEPETAKRWLDECLVSECDISQISWVLTANRIEGMPEPLLSRLRIERVGGPGPEHFESVLESILRDAATELGVAPMLLPPLEPEVIDWLRTAFARTCDVRRLRRAVTTALAHAAGRDTRVLH